MIAKDICKILSDKIPVTWDRFTLKDNYYMIYGWIKRRDCNRDFVLIYFENPCELSDVGFCTSSAKYSEQISTLLMQNIGHVGCINFEDI